MKALFVAALVGVLSVFGLALTAQAETPNCISKPEFNSVERGWKRVTVNNRFDVQPDNTSYHPQPAFNGGVARVDLFRNATCTDIKRDVTVTYERVHSGGELVYVARQKCWWIAGDCRGHID